MKHVITLPALILSLVAAAGCSSTDEGRDEAARRAQISAKLTYLKAHTVKTFDDLVKSGQVVLTPEQTAEWKAKGYVLGAVPDALLPVAHAAGTVIEVTPAADARLRDARARQKRGERGAVFSQRVAEHLFDPRDPSDLKLARAFVRSASATLELPHAEGGTRPQTLTLSSPTDPTVIATAPPPPAETTTTEPVITMEPAPVEDTTLTSLGETCPATMPTEDFLDDVPTSTLTADTTENIDLGAVLTGNDLALAGSLTTLTEATCKPCKLTGGQVTISKANGSQSWLYVNVADATLVTPAETQDIKDKKLSVIASGKAPDAISLSVTFTLKFEGKCTGQFTARNGPSVSLSNTTTTSAVAVNATTAKKNTGSVSLSVLQTVEASSTEYGAGAKKTAPMSLTAKMGSSYQKTETKGFGWSTGSNEATNQQTTNSGGTSMSKGAGQTHIDAKYDRMYTEGGSTGADAQVNGTTHETYVYSPADLSVQVTNLDRVSHDRVWYGEFGDTGGDENAPEVDMVFETKWSSSKLDAAHGGTGKSDYRVKVVGTETWETAKALRVSVVYGAVTVTTPTTTTATSGGTTSGGGTSTTITDPRDDGPRGP